MEIFNDLLGSITITSQNRMSGNVKIIGVGESDLTSTISTKYIEDIESSVLVYSNNIIDENGNFGNQIKSNLNVLNRHDMISTISIAPHNRMRIIAEVVEPPKTKTHVKKIEDAFIKRSLPTLNYSKYSNTFIGKNYQDEYRTLIKIDIDEIPKVNQIITKAELVLQKENYTDDIGKIELYEILEPWSEPEVTWKNQPKVGDMVASILIPTNPSEIRINILNKVNSWYNNTSKNNGFMMKVSLASKDDIAIFETRNQNDDIYQFGTSKSEINSPFAAIEYYDESLTYSSDIYKLPSAVTIRQNKDSDIISRLFVKSYWDKNELIGSITVPLYHQTEDLPSTISVSNLREENIPSSITVSKPQIEGSVNVYLSKLLLSKITVRKTDFNDLLSSITIRRNSQSDLYSRLRIESKNRVEDLNSSIIISKPDLIGGIKVKVFDDLVSNMQVRNLDKNELTSSLIVSQPELMGSIKVNVYGDIVSSISVKKGLSATLASNVIVSKPELISSINVYPTNSILGSITVINDYIKSSLTVRREEDNSIDTHITVRVLSVSELTSQLNVFKSSNLECSIVVVNNNKNDGETYVFIM